MGSKSAGTRQKELNTVAKLRSQASGILWKRGIIAEAAMKKGYLKISQEESRIKMLGATLTV